MCTANVCRSPMAEALLRKRLDQRGVEATVRSAGVLPGGMRAAPESVEAMAEWGVDLGSHLSRQVALADVRGADLVIGMAREHVRAAVSIDPSAWSRAFTLKELLRRGELAGPRAPGQPIGEWVAKVGADRDRRELMGSSSSDDVADPIGRPRSTFQRVAAEISGLVDGLVGLVWGPR